MSPRCGKMHHMEVVQRKFTAIETVTNEDITKNVVAMEIFRSFTGVSWDECNNKKYAFLNDIFNYGSKGLTIDQAIKVISCRS